ncbi:hypothetical protein EB796_015479 [Bugula neritina]|uniref:Methyltransferase type 11 domain-containing protein n=1 Tax=Bugula neritina TaxID=10212 RepID=A0A7J7JIW3_BUGNE|nr:hypothetical protein EB796_015479 [Bugula neritina]
MMTLYRYLNMLSADLDTPQKVFDIILEYTRQQAIRCKSGNFPLAVDVGCGPGLMSTSFLAPHFDKVLGIDISEAQIAEANANKEYDNIEYKVAQAENIPVEDNSVTLVQVATALHWLDHEKFYRECDRVLVVGGVIAAFSHYPDIQVIDHPNKDHLTRIFREVKGDQITLTKT